MFVKFHFLKTWGKIVFAGCFLLFFIQCNHKSSLNSNGENGPARIDFKHVWTNLGDSEGAVDFEMGVAAVESAEFSNNEKYVVSSARLGKNLRVWDTKSGKMVFEYTCPDVLKIALFSPDDEYLLAGGEFNQILIWRVSDWSLLETIDFDASVEGLRFSKNQKLLAVGDEAGIITLIDANNFEKIKTVRHREDDSVRAEIPRSDVNSVDFSPDDEYLISGSIDGKIKIWYVPDLRLIKTIDSGMSSVKSIRIDHKGSCFASASSASQWGKENAVKIWDFKSGDLLHSLTFPAGMESVEFSPKGNFLFCGGGGRIENNGKSPEGYIYVYYIPDDFLSEPIKQVHKQDVFRSEYLNVNKEGDKLVSAHEDGTVRLWNIIYKN